MLLAEILEFLRVRPGGTYLDCTLGAGGHARAIAGRCGKEGLVIALDQDPSALELARKNLGGLSARVRLVRSNFADAARVLDGENIKTLDGALLDLGVSSMQLGDPARGFSFESDFLPDMRMDPSRGRSAAELVNEESEEELARIFFEYGEEPKSRALARRLVKNRPIQSARQLAELARGLYPGHSRVHPATRLFQALRIAVNDELGVLDQALADLPGRLAAGGRLAVIAFHSLEDRRVKERFARLSAVEKHPVTGAPLGKAGFVQVTRKPVTPGEEEIARNLRARSAKLRVLERRAA